MSQREVYGARVGLVGIVCNVVLAAAKIFMGLAAGSTAVLSDAVNNLTDAAASLALVVGFSIAAKHPDTTHPFGHGRMEYIAAFIVACMIMLTGLGMGRFALGQIWEPQTLTLSPLILAGLVGSIVIKLGMGAGYYFANRKLRSQAVQAGITDSFSDAAVTAVTLFSFLLAGRTPFSADAAIGCIVAVLIFVAGAKSASESITCILGRAGDEGLVQEIHALLLRIDGVAGVHQLKVHDYGPSRKYATAHIELEPSMQFSEVHAALEQAIAEAQEHLGLELVLLPEPLANEGEAEGDVVARTTAGVTANAVSSAATNTGVENPN